MKPNVAVLLFCLGPWTDFALAAPLGTAFTYQGQLKDAGLPTTGTYDLQFRLFDAATAGAQVGSTLLKDDVTVMAGLFSVSLDFGAAAFAGQARFLEIGVRPGASSGAFTTLGARQELTPSPNAAFASKAADATTVAGLTCTNNQVAKWSGSTWTCGADTDTNSGGTVTSVTAGSGLSGGAITSSGTIAVAPLGITSSMIANGAVGSAQVNSAQVQTRIGGSCPPGLTIQTVNPDGTVVCRTASTQAGFSTTTVDSTGSVGEFTSIAIGTDGLGLISYYDNSNGGLKVAHCSNTACTTATSATLDSAGTVGEYTSLTIGSDGLGLISYYDSTNGDLKVAHCSDTPCSTATTATLDGPGPVAVGQYTSITIGVDGLGLISYYDSTNSSLKIAHCSDTPCSTASIATLDNTAQVGQYTSIAIGADGRGLISYYDVTNSGLKVAHCSDLACSAAAVATIDADGGEHSSIAIGADSLGLISYHGGSGTLRVAHCSNTLCSTATAATIDTNVVVGDYTSITIGADGLGLISHHNPIFGELRVAHCSNAACSAATLTAVDTTNVAGQFTSIAIGADGLGLISHRRGGAGDLEVVHCPNVECRQAVTAVQGGSGLVSGGTQNGTATISVNFAGSGFASTVARSDHNHDSSYWKLTGNAGITAGTHFLGRSDPGVLEIRGSAGVGINKSNPGSALDVLGTGTMTGLTVNGAANLNGMVQVTRTGAQATVFDGTSNHTGGSWLSIRNTGGGKSWNLISTGPTNGEGAGKFLLRSESDSSVVMTLDGATAPWVGIGTSARTANRQIETSSGASLTTGGVWTNSSDRNLKENLTPIAGDDLLSRLAKLPVYRWNYRTEPGSLTHIGPTAQDFEAAFGLGGDGRSISTIDPAGIALAAIQELNRRTEALTAAGERLSEVSRQLDSSQGQIARLKEQMAAVMAALERLTAKDGSGQPEMKR